MTRQHQTYDAHTALVVVDVQNDFADPAGALSVRGGEEVVGVVNLESAAAEQAGAFVCYTQDWHPAHTPHFEVDGGIWPVHCVQESWGAMLHPALIVRGPVVRKGEGDDDGYSGFSARDARSGEAHPTTLGALLRERGIERVVVVGLATDYCVRDTALDARRLGFDTTVLAAAVRAVDLQPGDGERAVLAMREAGVHIV
jgi:nicotinamidase/pyrazinamidase